MKVNIIRAYNFDSDIFNRLKELLKPFSKPIDFVFKEGTFNEPDYSWNRSNLNDTIQDFRQTNGIINEDFVLFLTTKRDSDNWFSACLEDWNRNIFVSTIEWTHDDIIETNKVEYPIAYQILENIFQYLISEDFNDYIQLGHEPAIGCINDMCGNNKRDIIFKLRTADICKDCQRIAEEKLETAVFDQIIEILENIRFQFLHNQRNFTIFQRSINKAKIEYLREIQEFVRNNLHNNETVIQNWIDEDRGRYRKQRSLIFGIDYVDPKREGEIHMRKRFDILAEQNHNSHVIIELKSPNADIFKITNNPNANDGQTSSYSISSDLSRAIPQILSYKRWYERMSEEEMQGLGLSDKKIVSECIIVIGQRKEDALWKQNFKDLQSNVNVKIMTYNDLIDKMSNTIENLENLLE